MRASGASAETTAGAETAEDAGSAGRKGQRTRGRILEGAADLFHARGVNATTLGDVLRATGTGKGQFYQHFPSREALVGEVLERHRAFLAGAPPIRTWDDLRAWMQHHLDLQRAYAFQRGCPVGTAAYALQPEQEGERATLLAVFGRMRDALESFLRQEQQAGRLRGDARPRRLADFAVAAVQGGLLLGLLDRAPEAPQGAIDEALAHLQHYRTEPRHAPQTTGGEVP